MLRMRQADSVSLISTRTISGPMAAPTDEQQTVTLLEAVSSTAIYVQRRAESGPVDFADRLAALERMAGEMVGRCLSRKK